VIFTCQKKGGELFRHELHKLNWRKAVEFVSKVFADDHYLFFISRGKYLFLGHRAVRLRDGQITQIA
jgi:hypothetical protein